ncbi:hypothetical protein TVAG_045620 [Trichomonas vaginalis G3]|uniref:SRP9 domain-containing protein n=1 Tax=Trichomonas vaginalis (strain ATCC PRA-98 / G3) TaxID=412133 RepID=A2DMD3_TRIV3|nr:signal recognition particle 9 kDa protein family [Trichomonas vaginalis G3]EAY18360.1 hypothetical protein TVAG_045620 [Trichomonas vaginalis G3]KAI5524175.1 signal recognition particle 9 kDa protein family [Trichomonas vaginalis G3]|eukprot:XP_001579346.1 hypothetical protein [Trichomonas vaginalis G3]
MIDYNKLEHFSDLGNFEKFTSFDAQLSMVLLTDIKVFEEKAKEMIQADPKKTRLTTKYKKDSHIFVMKIFNGKDAYKINIEKENDFKESQRIISSLLHLMTNEKLI